uniref:DNA-directed RNA polymerase RpoA/D/Rpb3-type domain-containing protein n=1 Tax=Panagrolaimus sp. JU765 TaxID=591449 RepID=A0AC34QJ74_9BILA
MATRRSTRISNRSETSDVEMGDVSGRRTSSSSPTKKPKDTRPPHVDPPEYEVVGDAFIQNTYDSHLNKRDLKNYLKKIQINIINENHKENTIEFDLINVETSIANALRRIMIAEVPTMALEKIYLYQNDTVFQDEVLCHRIGLMPIKADARQFEWPSNPVVDTNVGNREIYEEPYGDPKQNLVFEVKMKCQKKKLVPVDATNKDEHFENAVVKSKHFHWVPIGNQAQIFKDDPPKMVHDDIVILKMRHGQEIEARCHAVKGIGRDHAKFSPVGTASYRLLPEIILKETITGERAVRLQKSFSKGVIKLDDEGTAYVADSRADTLSRNVFRYDDLKDAVEIKRKKNHFIYSIESTGQYPADEIFTESCKVMLSKLREFRKGLQDLAKAAKK